MPRYRVMVETRVDVEAESEEAAKIEALKLVDADSCIAWEIENEF